MVGTIFRHTIRNVRGFCVVERTIRYSSWNENVCIPPGFAVGGTEGVGGER